MFTVFKKWPRISKLVLKSILLTVNLVYCRFKFNRYSYNSCTQPSKRQPHICTSTAPGTRMSVEGYLELLKMYWFIWVSCHLALSLGWGTVRIKLKGICLERNWRVSWCFKQGNNPWNAAKNSEVIHRPMEGNPRHSWILDSTSRISDSRSWIPIFFSGTRTLDSNSLWDSRFFQL